MKQNLFYKGTRAIVYVALVYARTVGSIFYEAMDRNVNEVETAAEMQRRATVLKRRL